MTKNEFLDQFNRIWMKNYPDLNFFEILINLPRLSKKKIKDMTDDEVLESMEILSNRIDKKTKNLGTTKELMDYIEHIWETYYKDKSFTYMIEDIWQKGDSDYATSSDKVIINTLSQLFKKETKNEM